MRGLAFVCILLSISVFADDLRVAVGIPRDKALTIIKANSGKDITPGLAVVGPKGEHPLHGFYWHLEEYKTVIEVSGKERVTGLTYWTLNDFGKSKDHRAKSAKEIAAFTIDPRGKRVLIEMSSNQGGGETK